MDRGQYLPGSTRDSVPFTGEDAKGKQKATSQGPYANQNYFNYGGVTANTFENPANTYYPLSPPQSEYDYSPSPFKPAGSAIYPPTSPSQSDSNCWSSPPAPSNVTQYPLSPPASEYNCSSPPSTTTTPFQILVRDLCGRTVTLGNIQPFTKLIEVKEKFAEKEDIPTHEQRFIFEGKEMEDDREVSYYNVRSGSTIHLVVRLKGGKQ